MIAGVEYEALNSRGLPYTRNALCINELPWEQRKAACAIATQKIAMKTGLEAVRSVSFGSPAYMAFGLTRPEARKHPAANLLFKTGGDLPLALCSSIEDQ